MTSRTRMILAVAAMAAVAGCAKKPPKELPPPPSQGAPMDNSTSPPPSNVGSTMIPGSREDFLAKAGTDTVYFGTDSIDLDGTSRAALDAQAAWLLQYRTVRVTIEGHCDERGTREYNLALGDRRANSAKNYLIGKGVDASRLSTISYGKERPAAMASDEDSWAKNRRAVPVVPVGGAG